MVRRVAQLCHCPEDLDAGAVDYCSSRGKHLGVQGASGIGRCRVLKPVHVVSGMASLRPKRAITSPIILRAHTPKALGNFSEVHYNKRKLLKI